MIYYSLLEYAIVYYSSLGCPQAPDMIPAALVIAEQAEDFGSERQARQGC